MNNQSPYLNGHLLIALPAMNDPRFHRAVIFICAHDPQGAMGLMLTQPVAGTTFGHLLEQLGYAQPQAAPLSLPVMSGGPVETVRGFMLHTPDFSIKDTIVITPDFSVTGTVEGLKKISDGDVPSKMIFALGYSGWSEGQLERELQDNAWLTVQPTPKLIFDTPADQMWEQAFALLGINPVQISSASVSGRAQ